MKVLVVFALTVALFAAAVSSAEARSSRASAKAHFYHADGYIKAIGKNASRTIYSSNARVRHKWRRDLHYLVRVRHRAYLKLHPAPRVLWPPHHALWLCIHGGEGAWNDSNSGNNGHFGGLQMTPGWGALASGQTANSLSQLQQEWLAENEGAKYHFASWWLWQQWAADARCF